MMARHGERVDDSPARQARLESAYARQVQTLKVGLARRLQTRVLFLNHADILSNPRTAAEALNSFLGANLNTKEMASRVTPSLYRQRS